MNKYLIRLLITLGVLFVFHSDMNFKQSEKTQDESSVAITYMRVDPGTGWVNIINLIRNNSDLDATIVASFVIFRDGAFFYCIEKVHQLSI